MFKTMYRVFLCSLSACALLMCAACSPAENKVSKSTEQLAQEFSELWLERWDKLPEEEKGMMLPEGRIFLEDLNGDKTPELFFVTAEWRDAAVAAFDLGKEPIVEIGSFRATTYLENDEVVFSVFDGKDGKVLHSESCLATGFADPTVPITDYYVTYNGKDLEITTLYRVESKDSEEIKYFESPYDDTEITSAEYDQRREGAENNGKLTKEITASGKDVEFLVKDNLQEYVLSRLNEWEAENRA